MDLNVDGEIATAEEAVVTEIVTEYDELGRRVREYEQSPSTVPLASRRVKKFCYDKTGRLLAVIQPPPEGTAHRW